MTHTTDNEPEQRSGAFTVDGVEDGDTMGDTVCSVCACLLQYAVHVYRLFFNVYQHTESSRLGLSDSSAWPLPGASWQVHVGGSWVADPGLRCTIAEEKQQEATSSKSRSLVQQSSNSLSNSRLARAKSAARGALSRGISSASLQKRPQPAKTKVELEEDRSSVVV